jgi:hypothetical protein
MSPLAWAALLFAAGLVVSTALTLAVLVGLAPDHFTRRDRTPRRLAWVVLRNLLGLILVAAGLVLALPGIPGQGLLTIFAGMLLLDIPGKRRLELAVLRRPAIRKAVDRLRSRCGRGTLQFPGEC